MKQDEIAIRVDLGRGDARGDRVDVRFLARLRHRSTPTTATLSAARHSPIMNDESNALIARARSRCSRASRRCCRRRRRIPTGRSVTAARWRKRGGPRLPAGRSRIRMRSRCRRSRRDRRAEAGDRPQHAPVRRRPAREQRAADGLARHRQVVAGQGDARAVRTRKGLRLIEVDKADLDRPARHRRPASRHAVALHRVLRRPDVRRGRGRLQGAEGDARRLDRRRRDERRSSTRRRTAATCCPSTSPRTSRRSTSARRCIPGESVEEKISLSERFGLVDLVLSVRAGRLSRGGRRAGSRISASRRREPRAMPTSARAKRCSSRCSAARAAAASRGSSRVIGQAASD